MLLHDSSLHGAANPACSLSHSNNARAERQADLVSKIMAARKVGSKATERRLSAELLESVRPVIKQVANRAKRFSGSQSVDDLEQVAAIAVLRTIDKYDPTRGGQSFGEVAYFRARTACEQFTRMHSADVHVSDGAQKGRTLRATSAEQVTVRVESTDATVRSPDAVLDRNPLAEQMENALRRFSERDANTDTPEGIMIAAEQRARVFDAVRGLAPDRRELVSRVYGINQPAQSVRSVAEAWGAPKSRVDRMLARALAELRELLATEGH